MKNFLTYFTFISFLIVSCQQEKSNNRIIKLQTHFDTISYSLGVIIGEKLKTEGFDKINYSVLINAINKAINSNRAEDLLIDPNVAKDILKLYLYQEHKKKLKIKTTQWQSFLTQNAKRAGVHTTNSGLQYEILKRGHGQKPNIRDYVVVKYIGYLPSGVIFDKTYSHTPAIIRISNTIKGWQEALVKMNEGSKWRIFLPPYLAFGNTKKGIIEPNSIVIYEIELLKIKNIK